MAFEMSSGRSGARKDVNITPLIDVVLVLLIIFMVLSPTALKHMKPQVAEEATTAVPPGPAPVLVELSAGGDVSVSGQATEWARLQEVVRDGLAHSRQTAVHFKISDDVEYGRAVRLLDLCKGAGARVLGLPPGWRAS